MKFELSADQPIRLVTLQDYATPDFCSFHKWYAGTEEMLAGFFAALGRQVDEGEEGSYETDVIETYHRYLAGEQDAETLIASEIQQLVRPLDVLGIGRPTEMAPYTTVYRSAWDVPYYIQAEAVRVQLVYARCGETYARFALAEFEKGKFGSEPDCPRENLGVGFWGHPAMITQEGDVLYNRLMFLERRFDSRAALEEDLQRPAELDFSGFMDDLFGEG